MKLYALLASAVLLASPAAFAEEDLCRKNMEEIEASMAAQSELDEPTRGQVQGHVEEARQARQAGDTDGCIVHSTKALQQLKAPGVRPPEGDSGTGSGNDR